MSQDDTDVVRMIEIMCFDPGKTTGLFHIHEGSGTTALQVDNWEDVTDMALELAPNAMWVYERFLIGPQTLKKARYYESLWCEGTIRREVRKRGIEACGQIPNAGIPATDDVLKTLGYWRPSMRHAMDAARHGVVWSLLHGHLSIDQVQEPEHE